MFERESCKKREYIKECLEECVGKCFLRTSVKKTEFEKLDLKHKRVENIDTYLSMDDTFAILKIPENYKPYWLHDCEYAFLRKQEEITHIMDSTVILKVTCFCAWNWVSNEWPVNSLTKQFIKAFMAFNLTI